MFWQFFPVVLGYFAHTHSADLSSWSFAAFHGVLRALAWAIAEILIKLGDPTGHLGLPHSPRMFSGYLLHQVTWGSCGVSKHPCAFEQSGGCCGAAGSPWSPGSCASTKGSPRRAPFAQKTVVSKGQYLLQLLVCTNELNFCRKSLQVVVVNSCLKIWHHVDSD